MTYRLNHETTLGSLGAAVLAVVLVAAAMLEIYMLVSPVRAQRFLQEQCLD